MKIIIPGEPVAQGRPRVSTIGGFPRVYDPPKSKKYKEMVGGVARQHVKTPLDESLKVKIDVYRQIPKSFSKKKTLEAQSGLLRPITKPDIDNYIKGILDGCNGIVWTDDSKVVDLHVSKFYSSEPRVEIDVSVLENQLQQQSLF